MATVSKLFGRFFRRALKPRTTTVRRKHIPLSQMTEQFELELRWLPTQFPVPGFGTLSAAVAAASPGETIQLSAGDYYDWVSIDKDGIIIQGVAGSVIRPLTTNPYAIGGNSEGNGTVPGAGHLISVLADNVQIRDVTLNGAGNGTVGTANVGAGNATVNLNPLVLNGTPIGANKGITNYQGQTDYHSISNVTIVNSTFLNFGGHAIAFDGTLDGGTISNNTISNYGVWDGQTPFAGANSSWISAQPWSAISLLNNSIADVTENTITVPVDNYGIRVDNYGFSSDGASISNNTVTVNLRGIGITINNVYDAAQDLTVANNTINAANGVGPSSLLAGRGINVYTVAPGHSIALNHNAINSNVGNGVFDRGIALFDVSNSVSITGGSIARAAIGINLDGVDPYFGSATQGNATVNISGATVDVNGSTYVGVQATNLANTTQQPGTAPNPSRPNAVTSNVTINITGGTVTNAGTGFDVTANANGPRTAVINLLGNTTIATKLNSAGGNGFVTSFSPLRQYDFGAVGVAQPGFTPFPSGSALVSATSTTGVGFVGNNPAYVTQAGGSNLTKDVVKGGAAQPATFHVPALAGNYTLTIYVGFTQGGASASTTVSVGSSEGTLLANTTRVTSGNGTAATPVGNAVITANVTLNADGYFNFNFSTAASNWAVAGVSINRTGDAPPL